MIDIDEVVFELRMMLRLGLIKTATCKRAIEIAYSGELDDCDCTDSEAVDICLDLTGAR